MREFLKITGGLIAVIQKYKERIKQLTNENQSLLDQQKQQQHDIGKDNSSKMNMEAVYPFLVQLSFMCYNLFKVQEFLAKLLAINFFAPHISSLNSGGVENKGDDKNENKSNLVEKDDNENKDDDNTIRSPGH